MITHDEQQVAKNAGELGDKSVRPLLFEGHCFYVRKCTTGNQVDSDFWRRQLGGIELPQTAVERSLTVEVLAIGPKVGKPCSKRHMKVHKRAKCLSMGVQVGSLVLCPNMHPTGIQRSPLAQYEYFIEESIPLAVLNE